MAPLAPTVLEGADHQDADLNHANLMGADLRGFNLKGTYLYGANLRGANLEGAGATYESGHSPPVITTGRIRRAKVEFKYKQEYLDECRADVERVLATAPAEVPGLPPGHDPLQFAHRCHHGALAPGVAVVSGHVENILRVWQGASPDQRAAGAAWYPRAHQTVRGLAWAHCRPVHQAAGVISALSPRNRWTRNLVDAALLLQGRRRGFCTFAAQVTKAVECLSCRDMAGVLEVLGGQKTKAFVALLADPSADAVVVDGHALCIAEGVRRPLAACHVSKGAYRRLADAYRTAAQRLGVAPSTVQATTWIAWRETHGVA